MLTLTSAERQRRYRERRRYNVCCVTVEVPQRVVDKLRNAGLATDDAEFALIMAETFTEAVDTYLDEYSNA